MMRSRTVTLRCPTCPRTARGSLTVTVVLLPARALRETGLSVWTRDAPGVLAVPPTVTFEPTGLLSVAWTDVPLPFALTFGLGGLISVNELHFGCLPFVVVTLSTVGKWVTGSVPATK